ncbi:MAG: hypothetical protein AAF828_10000 [Bacteroidota bacterium]
MGVNRWSRLLFLVAVLLSTVGCPVDELPSPSEINYDCFAPNAAEEVFVVIEEEPVFGNGMEDVEEYIDSFMVISLLDQIIAGEIKLSIIVLASGEACLSRVQGIGVPEASLMDHRPLIANMPSWVPGQQGGISRNTQVVIDISIQDGAIEEIVAGVGR